MLRTRRASSSGPRRSARRRARAARLGRTPSPGQSIFHQSQFTLLLHDFERRGNNLGFAYFHGRPGTPGMPEFDACFDTMRRRHEEIDRVQVTNREMEELVLETGMGAEKVHRIPIGIDVETFPLRSPDGVAAARRAFGLPESAFVVGSFQKDGVGWGEGTRAEADQGAGRAALASRSGYATAFPSSAFLLTGPVARLRPGGSRAARHPVPRMSLLDDVDAVARRVRGDRRLRGRVARRGRAARRARVDGDAASRSSRPAWARPPTSSSTA